MDLEASRLDKKDSNRKLVAFIVIFGTIIAFVIGGTATVLRTIGITEDKALYFSQNYSSTFDVFKDDNETPEDLKFNSKSTSDEDNWQVIVKYEDKTYDSCEVNQEGFIWEGSDQSEYYFFLWWEEEALTLSENTNGLGRSLIPKVEEKEVKDPYDLFLNQSQTYIAEFKETLIYLTGRFATQASLKYIIKRNSDSRIVGDAIVDQTSGLAFELNLYEEGYPSVKLVLKETTFIISRNRHHLLTSASIVLPVSFAILYILLRRKEKRNSIKKEEMKECLFLGGIGFIAAWSDLFFDFWYTWTPIMPFVLIMHFVPIILILSLRRELWHYIFIPLGELSLFGVLSFFNMGIFVLWLAFGNVLLWLALLAHYAYNDKIR